MNCNLCPRSCNAYRTEFGNVGGFCGMPEKPKIAKAGLHFWEEPCISGKRGSGTVFFSGCTLRCVYCQNYELSHKGFGKTVSVTRLAEIFSELEEKGAHNINLVNPTHYVEAIENALIQYRPRIPIVYNSSGYEKPEIGNKNFIDVYLFDLKYSGTEKALKYSAAADYFEVATAAIKASYERIGECEFTDDGIMKKGIIIRHLLLPSSTNDATRIIDWAYENCPGAVFSLMSQYLPCGEAHKFKELNRKITAREYEKVTQHLMQKNFAGAYIQERSSSDGNFIPEFDLEGV